jgi:hypothetical protein
VCVIMRWINHGYYLSYLTYPSYIRCMMYLIDNITCVTFYNSDLIFKFFMDDLLWALSSTLIKEFYRNSFLLFVILIFEKAIISHYYHVRIRKFHLLYFDRLRYQSIYFADFIIVILLSDFNFVTIYWLIHWYCIKCFIINLHSI